MILLQAKVKQLSLKKQVFIRHFFHNIFWKNQNLSQIPRFSSLSPEAGLIRRANQITQPRMTLLYNLPLFSSQSEVLWIQRQRAKRPHTGQRLQSSGWRNRDRKQTRLNTKNKSVSSLGPRDCSDIQYRGCNCILSRACLFRGTAALYSLFIDTLMTDMNMLLPKHDSFF